MTPEQQRILELESENRQLKADLTALASLAQQLLQEIERLKHPKNSRNSSVPRQKMKTAR
ncbi:MAG: hypothetical protein M0P66_02025 [Salinivirgaceae bacterium]|nr:hypothetical protein [Salinivirgaceae bacterium]